MNPARKIYYNITTTGFSVGVALLIGTIELLQMLIAELHLHGSGWDRLEESRSPAPSVPPLVPRL